MRADWDFGYLPVATCAGDDDGVGTSLVVATRVSVDPGKIQGDLARAGIESIVDVLCDRAPIHWYRLLSSTPALREDVERALVDCEPRYVASMCRASQALGAPWEPHAAPCMPDEIEAAGAPSHAAQDSSWHLGEHGLGLDRELTGIGRGMRIAVIDDEMAESGLLDLDREVCIGVDVPSRAGLHGSLMGAWAVGCRRRGGGHYVGIAPGASLRAYVIPKPGADVSSLPLAIVRAAIDGADVIVCATYVEGTTSPMLDDALAFASRLGRRGLGTVVVLPTGREASCRQGEVHASWTLGLGEPASDPRVFCVGPSSRQGEWFTWRDRRQRAHPFANRGPAVRALAPGDDVPYPLAQRNRPFHAESSGASAMTAGVVALVLEANPELTDRQVAALLVATATEMHGAFASPEKVSLADAEDARPHGVDRDGHNAKHGHGRLSATRACVAARDPLALAWTEIGEDAAAREWSRRPSLVSPELARWTVCVALDDPSIDHRLKTLARHLRLVAASSQRVEAHGVPSLARQVALLCRELKERAPAHLAAELDALVQRLTAFTRNPPADGARWIVRALDGLWSASDAMFNVPVPA